MFEPTTLMMRSTHKKKNGKKYVNPFSPKDKRNLLNWIGFCFGLYKDKHPRPKIPKHFIYPQKDQKIEKHQPKVTWINHSTFLIEVGKLRLLTDPIWSERCSPVSFVGPKRQHAPGIKLERLAKIDLVLISHNHYDHLDKETVKALHLKYPQILWIIPKGMKKWFSKIKIKNTLEFDWWDAQNIEDKNIRITAVPSQHFSGRHPFDINRTPWNGYVLEFLDIGKKLYFVGDTGYNQIHFNEIGEAFKEMDLSLIPIGAYSPQKFMQPVHISPCEAVHIHREVNSKLSVGSHHSTFPLSKEKIGQPSFDLYHAIKEAELDHNSFRVLQPGQTINW